MQIIDDAISPSLLRAVWADWPDENWIGWHLYYGENSIKYGTRDAELIRRGVWPALYALERTASVMADRRDAFADWDLFGAGMHMIPPGGHLARHLDSDIHARTGWRRELSCVLFANPDWNDDWGGEFVIDGLSVQPKFNRAICFPAGEDAWHQVLPVTGPVPRCTLSLFFWSTRNSAGRRRVAEFS